MAVIQQNTLGVDIYFKEFTRLKYSRIIALLYLFHTFLYFFVYLFSTLQVICVLLLISYSTHSHTQMHKLFTSDEETCSRPKSQSYYPQEITFN